MARQLRVGCSPLSNNIYAGSLCVDGRTWRDGKQDVTIDALVSVAEHVERFGQPVRLYGCGDAPSYEITVRRIDAASPAEQWLPSASDQEDDAAFAAESSEHNGT